MLLASSLRLTMLWHRVPLPAGALATVRTLALCVCWHRVCFGTVRVWPPVLI